MRAIRGHLDTGSLRAQRHRTEPAESSRRERRPLRWLWFLLALGACAIAAPVAAAIPPSERQALLDLYAATQGAGWRDSTGWTGAAGTECSWYGVRCDGAGERVVELNLFDNRLRGTLPALDRLPGLALIQFGANELSGPLPALGNLRGLRFLFVFDNQFSGPLPSLAGLDALEVVYAFQNKFSGPLPSLADTPGLRDFRVYVNEFSGSIPPLAGRQALRGYIVDNNQLTGTLPSLAGLVNLELFSAANNQLVGTLPSLEGLAALQLFSAGGNSLTGTIPSLAGLRALTGFYVGPNQLSGPIPSLADQRLMEWFDVQGNQLSGSIPPLAGLTRMTHFYVYNNRLTGSIPPLAGLTSLQWFIVDNNELSGEIPPLAGLTSLIAFYAWNNGNLSGPIPPLAGLNALRYFAVDNNRLSGAIPALSGLAALEYFQASGNALSGAFPPLAGLANLRGFYVQNNTLSGAIPPLTGLANLRSFYVFGNQLSGPVPAPAPPGLLANSRLCPNLLDRVDNTGWDAATGVTPWWRDCTVNPNLKVSGTLESQTLQQLEAPSGAQDYAWIVDGDGSFDRSGTQANLQVRYPTEFNSSVSVRSRGSSGATTTTTIALRTEAPRLVAFAGTPVEACGNGDGVPQPGERFNVPLGFTNEGAVGLRDGYAMFAAREQLDAAGAGQVAAPGMTVETPLLGIGALAPRDTKPSGQQPAPITATVALAAGAACGSSYGLRFTGSVDRLSFSKGQRDPIAVLTIPAGAACRPYTGACDAVVPAALSKAVAAPRQGLYYNPERPGNGLSNFLVASAGGGTTYFGLWFTAGPDRIPTWYLIQGPKTGNSVVAPIYKLTRDMNAATFTVRLTIVGQAQVVQKGAEQLFLYWQIGSRAGLESMSYLVPGPAPNPNRTGAWFNPAESGWGQVVHQFVANGQVNSFKVDFLYDDAGEPRWLLAQAPQDALTAPLPHFTYAAHCPGCPWISDWNDQSTAAGNGSQTLLDATSGRTTTRYTLPAPYRTTWNRDELPLILLTDPQ